MSLLQRLDDAAVGEWYAILSGEVVYRFQRVTSDQLRRVGFAILEGSRAARSAAALVAQTRREEIATFGARSPEEREAALRSLAERDEREAAKRTADMLATAEGEQAFLARCDAYIMAAVTGGALLPTPEPELGAVVATRNLPDGVKIDAFRFVETRVEHSADDGRVWIDVLPESRRVALGLAIQRSLDVTPEVLPFRPRPRDTSAAGETLGMVGQDAPRAATAGPVGDGAR